MLIRATSFGGVAGFAGAASGYLWGDAPLGAIAALVVLATVCLGAGAYFAGVRLPTVNTPTCRRAGSAVLAGLLVSSIAVAPVAAGPLGFQDCGVEDSAISAIIASFSAPNEDGTCRFNPDDADQYENITETDAYATGLAMRDSEETYFSVRQNFAQDIRGVMWMKAKIEVVEHLNNGSTEAEARAAAKAAVNDYLSRVMATDLRDYEARSHQIAFLANQTGATAGGTTSQKFNNRAGSEDVRPYGSTATTYWNLPNGTNISVDMIATHFSNTNDNYDQVELPYTPTAWDNISWTQGEWEHGSLNTGNINVRLYIKNASGGKSVNVIENDQRDTVMQEYVEARDQILSNLDTYVNDTYSLYESGEINSSDLVDPVTLAQEASTDYNSTGYYAFANAELAALGSTGNSNVSHVVETTWQQVSYPNGSKSWTNQSVNITGTLYLTNASNMSLETGKTYDPNNITGSVYMSVSAVEATDGTSLNYSDGFFYVDDPFTIHEATNTKTGEPVNVTTAESKNYSSTNVSALKQQLQSLLETREYYDEQQSAAAGGGSGLSTSELLLGGAALAGVALWARDRSNGGGRSQRGS